MEDVPEGEKIGSLNERVNEMIDRRIGPGGVMHLDNTIRDLSLSAGVLLSKDIGQYLGRPEGMGISLLDISNQVSTQFNLGDLSIIRAGLIGFFFGTAFGAGFAIHTLDSYFKSSTVRALWGLASVGVCAFVGTSAGLSYATGELQTPIPFIRSLLGI